MAASPASEPASSLSKTPASTIRFAAASAQAKPGAAVHKKSRARHIAEEPPTRFYQVGKASWYGRYFHGRPTASGEPYDMFNLTAASRDLPLGTWLKVTNLRNGNSVVVRVNDRGPVPKSRILDLSFEAATLLDLRAHGVERVRLDIVKPTAVALNLNLAQLQ
jgi:rare lipoprotein A